MREANKVGGGAKTNLNGLRFEQTTSLRSLLEAHPDFDVKGDEVLKNSTVVAELCGKYKLYNFLARFGVDHSQILSCRLLPDEALIVGKTGYIIEKKFQGGVGTVDEKLQTCDFKKKQYTKLFGPIGFKVEYIYILNDWFRQEKYKDVHTYILESGCHFFFNEIPLSAIGLQVNQ